MNKTDVHFLCNLLRNELQIKGKLIANVTLYWKSIYLLNYFNPSLFHYLLALHWS